MHLGEALKIAREDSGLTVRDLAKRVGVSYSLISKFEKQSRTPDVVTLVKIRRELGLGQGKLCLSRNSGTEREGGEVQWKIIKTNKIFKFNLTFQTM